MIEETKETKKNHYTRHTHCFSCKQNINSQQYDVCESCNGIVCSCGSCFCEWEGDRYDY